MEEWGNWRAMQEEQARQRGIGNSRIQYHRELPPTGGFTQGAAHTIGLQRSLQNGRTHSISTIYDFFSTIIHNCLFKYNASQEERPRRDFTRHTKMFTGKENSMIGILFLTCDILSTYSRNGDFAQGCTRLVNFFNR